MGTPFFTPALLFFTQTILVMCSFFTVCCCAGTAEGTFHCCTSGAQEGGCSGDQTLRLVWEVEARLQHSTIPILSTTQNYRFTSQVYSTFPFLIHLSPDFVLLISLH